MRRHDLIRVLFTAAASGALFVATAASAGGVVLEEGSSEGSASVTPWSGDWYQSAEGALALGSNGVENFRWNAVAGKYEPVDGIAVNDLSPLRKYDLFVARRFGSDPGAAAYELHGDKKSGGDLAFDHHVDPNEAAAYDDEGTTYGWWGHCNGWAEASIAEREPFAPIVAEGIRFDVADLKGLLSEVYSGVQTRGADTQAANGKWSEKAAHMARVLLSRLERAQGESNSTSTSEKSDKGESGVEKLYAQWTRTTGYEFDENTTPESFAELLKGFIAYYETNYDIAQSDLDPVEFHKILVTTIKDQKSGVIFDTDSTEEVWNFPCYAYDMSVEFSGDLPDGGRRFSVKTTLHFSSDGVDESILGVTSQSKTYTYEIATDANDAPIRGTWTGSSVAEHPDFAWVPTYNPTGADYGENKKIEFSKVRELLTKDHATTDARILALSVNGAASDTHRPAGAARTAAFPYVATGPVKLTSSVLKGVKIDSVTYERVSLAPVKPSGYKVAVGDAELLGASKTPPYGVAYGPKEPGIHMIVARAHAGSELVSQDEFTVRWVATEAGSAEMCSGGGAAGHFCNCVGDHDYLVFCEDHVSCERCCDPTTTCDSQSKTAVEDLVIDEREHTPGKSYVTEGSSLAKAAPACESTQTEDKQAYQVYDDGSDRIGTPEICNCGDFFAFCPDSNCTGCCSKVGGCPGER